MRPRKVIYLYCQDEVRRSVLCCVLQTWHFQVTTQLRDRTPDVVLIVHDELANHHVRHLDHEYRQFGTVVLIKRKQLLHRPICNGTLMLNDNVNMIELREHLQTIAARKRGPKPFQMVAREGMTA